MNNVIHGHSSATNGKVNILANLLTPGTYITVIKAKLAIYLKASATTE